MVNVITCTHDKKQLNFVYKRRSDYDQAVSLGIFIKKMEVLIPGGILVFFASYEMMQYTMKQWDHQQIKFQREVFCEAKTVKDFEEIFKKYLKRINRGKRALLACVCRGKLSEGIDFVDNAARAIFVVGIPYPCVNDPRVLQKQQYLDLKKKEEPNFELDGQKWYKLQAARTVNQAIGRVIRHIKDYGCIFLCDERYQSSTVEISKWMKDRKKVWDRRNIDKLDEEVSGFFESNQARFKLIDKVCKKRRVKDIEDLNSEVTTVLDSESTRITYEGDSKR